MPMGDPADEFLGAEIAAPADAGPPEGHALAEIAPRSPRWSPGGRAGIVQYAKGSELLTLAVKATATAMAM
jgi:two-component system nitrogen regulation sensor histidine kinase NtrY